MRIGVDLGGTKIECIALAEDGNVLAKRRVSSPRGDYNATIDAIRDLVGQIAQETGRNGSIGIGIPGTVSPASGLIKNANSTWLIGKAFDRDLADALGQPVRIANDANCFALSEAVDGAGAGTDVVFGVILGTGTGGGIVVNGAVLTGPNAIAGEWGHNPLPWFDAIDEPPRPCYCGKESCIETYLSGPALAREHAAATGEELQAQEIADLANNGDEKCRQTLQRYSTRLAKALASVLNVIDPDVVVLGGGLSNIDRLYEDVPRLWGQYAFSDQISTRLLPAKHGDSSGVRGAAWLWPVDEAIK